MQHKTYDISDGVRKTVTENKNFLVTSNGFRMVFARAPNVAYFLQTFSVPTVSVNETPVARGKQIAYFPGDFIQFEPLTVTMLVAEDMNNFKEIYDWLYRNINANHMTDKFDDLTIYILNSKNNVNKTLVFKNAFPTSMSNINFTVTDADVVYATVDITFRYDEFTFE
jgi:hypothetical protein